MSKITEAARGEPCLVWLPGCKHHPDYSIWSHYRGSAGGKGRGLKSCDLAGAIACTYCDGVYDGQIKRPPGLTKEDVDSYWILGHFRSLKRLTEKGTIK